MPLATIQLPVRNEEELDKLHGEVMIASDGVLTKVPFVLVPNKVINKS